MKLPTPLLRDPTLRGSLSNDDASRSWSVFPVSGALIVAMLFGSGMTIQTSLILAVIVTIGSIGMIRITRHLGLGASIAGGMAVFLCVVVPLAVLVSVLFGGIFEPLPIALLILLAVVILPLAKNEISESSREESPVTVLALASIVLLSLVTKMWFFLTPLFIGVLALMFLMWWSKRLEQKAIRIALVSMGTSIFVAASIWSHLLSRTAGADGAIFRTTDQYFRTTMGMSVVTFGVNDNMGAVGTPLRYHWLGEAFMNVFGRLSFSAPIDAIVRISPVLGTLATAAAMYWFVFEAGRRRSEAFFGVLMITTLSVLLYSQGINILKPTEVGQFWGTPLFLTGVFIAYRLTQTNSSRLLLALIIWYPPMVMTNTTLGTAFACGCGATLLLGTVRRRVSWWKTAAAGAAMAATLVVLRDTLLASTTLSAFSPQFGLNDPFGFAFAFGYDGDNGFDKMVSGLAFIAVLWFQGGAVLGFRSKGSNSGARDFLALFCGVAVLPAFFISILDGAEQYRFLNPLLILGPVSLALGLSKVRETINLNRIVLALVLAAAVRLGLESDVLAKTFGDFEVMRPRIYFAGWLLVVPLVGYFVFRFWPFKKGDRGNSSPRMSGVFGLTSVVVSVTAVIYAIPGQVEYATSLESPTKANAGRIECLEFIRDNSDPQTTIASYMWRFGDDPSTEKWFIASAVSERRTFIDGPIYVENPQSDWIKLRQDITTRFVEIGPNYADRAVMLKAGVEYFVVDSRWTKRQSWKPFAERVFSNTDCIVLKLNDPSR